MRAYRPFRGLRVFSRDEMEESGPPLTTKVISPFNLANKAFDQNHRTQA